MQTARIQPPGYNREIGRQEKEVQGEDVDDLSRNNCSLFGAVDSGNSSWLYETPWWAPTRNKCGRDILTTRSKGRLTTKAANNVEESAEFEILQWSGLPKDPPNGEWCIVAKYTAATV
ncbi:unnamed protein product [Victoria cruziana]